MLLFMKIKPKALNGLLLCSKREALEEGKKEGKLELLANMIKEGIFH